VLILFEMPLREPPGGRAPFGAAIAIQDFRKGHLPKLNQRVTISERYDRIRISKSPLRGAFLIQCPPQRSHADPEQRSGPGLRFPAFRDQLPGMVDLMCR
jgi:hypothetical protein